MVHTGVQRTFLERWTYSTARLDDETVLGNDIFLIFGVIVCTCACAGFLALACVEARSQHSHSLLLLDLLSLNLETGWAGLPALSGCWRRPASPRLLEGAGDRAVALMLPQHSTH